MNDARRLLNLRKVVEDAQKKTREVHEARAEKAKAKPLVLKPTSPEPEKHPATSTDVFAWFVEGMAKLHGRKIVVCAWTIPQKTLAKKLLQAYGEELVHKAVDRFCSTWNEIVQGSRGRLTGAPTINLLWGMRERIFADIQIDKPAKMVKLDQRERGEYEKPKDAPVVGW